MGNKVTLKAAFLNNTVQKGEDSNLLLPSSILGKARITFRPFSYICWYLSINLHATITHKTIILTIIMKTSNLKTIFKS